MNGCGLNRIFCRVDEKESFDLAQAIIQERAVYSVHILFTAVQGGGICGWKKKNKCEQENDTQKMV